MGDIQEANSPGATKEKEARGFLNAWIECLIILSGIIFSILMWPI